MLWALVAALNRHPHRMADTFLYFAYGSNLLRERILINNPSAVFKTIARLDNFVLAFDNHKDDIWYGASATIRRSDGSAAWGAVWELSNADIPNLDRQEGVDEGIYRPMEVTVESPGGERLTCRCYELLLTSPDKLPSPQYLGVIQRGAAQNNLPPDYQRHLAEIRHNGYSGPCRVLKEVQALMERFRDKDGGS